MIPERHRALASRYGPPGIRIRDMTRQQLDDERHLFLVDVQKRWERKIRAALRSKDIDEEFARSEINAGHPSYRDPRRATVRESQRESARRRYAEDTERQRKRDQAAFWKNKGSPEDIKRKLQLPL